MVRILAALFFSAVCAQAALAGAHLTSVPDAPIPMAAIYFTFTAVFWNRIPMAQLIPAPAPPMTGAELSMHC